MEAVVCRVLLYGRFFSLKVAWLVFSSHPGVLRVVLYCHSGFTAVGCGRFCRRVA